MFPEQNYGFPTGVLQPNNPNQYVIVDASFVENLNAGVREIINR